jgi:hypothetical protein
MSALVWSEQSKALIDNDLGKNDQMRTGKRHSARLRALIGKVVRNDRWPPNWMSA